VNVIEKLGLAASIEAHAARIILRHGLPDAMLQFGGGIGDELLLTTVAHELKRRDSSLKIWQVSHSAELLRHNQDYAKIFTWDDRYLRYAFLLRGRRRNLAYAVERIPQKEEVPPSEHILAVLCTKVGITGSVALRPYLSLTDEERNNGSLGDFQITVQCLGPESFRTVMLNKLWSTEKFQHVVDGLHAVYGRGVQIIQIGGAADPMLRGVTDLRGKTTLRESAALIHRSRFFIGTVGLGMHLARAVDCRSVIIYGGREHSWQSGYSCNENIDSFVECAPCWQWHDCDYERKCMTMISVEHVMAAVERLIKRLDTPIEIDTVII
jgi:ADP-heptose:LPS heptosyltransferase